MTAPEPPRPAFLAVPSIDLHGQPSVKDRTADLGTAIVSLSLGVHMHLHSATHAAQLARVFDEAAQLLSAAGRP